MLLEANLQFTKEQINKIVLRIIESELFQQVGDTIHITSSTLQPVISFKLKTTNFYLVIVFTNYYGSRYTLCWEKRGKIEFQNYSFFEMMEEIPVDLQSRILFYLDIFSLTDNQRFRFRK